MALKKSEIYSSLWSSCDELRGGMDASQYKDYVLVMLFIKYISDKYAGLPFAPIAIPKGASFKDMVALKGKATIGDDINKKIIGPIADANKLSDMPDFNDVTKLGSGKEMVDRLTNLISIFERKELDFSRNRTEGDDILGDAYEYLMRNFATESGKSKGQFYTPAEVSRVMARIIGINSSNTTAQTTVYEENEYNLNIPRYIDSQKAEDIQDIGAHLFGGISDADIDMLNDYWEEFGSLREALFRKGPREKYSVLKVNKDVIKDTIFEHPEFKAFTEEMNALFSEWKNESIDILKGMEEGLNPKEVIEKLSESLLARYADKSLISKYDVYQHLMDYWAGVMQDDCYIISAGGWKAETYRILVENKQKKMVDKGWACDLIPKELVIGRYFLEEKLAIEALEAEVETLAGQLSEMEEEQGGEDGYFAELDKVNKVNVLARLKGIKGDIDAREEIEILESYLDILNKQSETNKKIKEKNAELDKNLYNKYPTLTVDEIKTLVVDDKWMAAIERDIDTEMDRVSQRLAGRVKELAERYETPLHVQEEEVKELEDRVASHLMRMGFGQV